MKPLLAVTLLLSALTAPAVAQGAVLTKDPDQACYRETETVFLPGSGFTPNANVDFARGGTSLGPIPTDAAGTLTGELVLPGLASGQQTLTYTATDTVDPAITASVSLIVTATDVTLEPKRGAPQRLLTIRGRGFFDGGPSLWAHVVRKGKSRNIRIGRIKGACKKVRARKRIFKRGAPFGTYRVQFDAFRRYKESRAEQQPFNVTIFPTIRRSAAASTSAWRAIR